MLQWLLGRTKDTNELNGSDTRGSGAIKEEVVGDRRWRGDIHQHKVGRLSRQSLVHRVVFKGELIGSKRKQSRRNIVREHVVRAFHSIEGGH